MSKGLDNVVNAEIGCALISVVLLARMSLASSCLVGAVVVAELLVVIIADGVSGKKDDGGRGGSVYRTGGEDGIGVLNGEFIVMLSRASLAWIGVPSKVEFVPATEDIGVVETPSA